MKNYIKYMALSAVLFTACEAELDNPIEEGGVYSSGSADFSTFVSVGNSLTSGYADGALYITGQQNSFPNILAGQFALAGGGEFTQPLMNDNLGGLFAGGSAISGFDNRLVLKLDEQGSLAPVRLEGSAKTDISNILGGSFNNMGVPGAKSFHLIAPGYGNIANLPAANPYFVRFASEPNSTIIADAVAQNPTFFSLWIGNNDILSYASSGGVGDDQKGNLEPSTYGPNDITDPQVFAGVYSQEVNALNANASGGVLFNIPDITSIPYFTTVPFAPLNPTSPEFAAQIPTLNSLYAQLNQAFAFIGVPERSVQFSTTSASAVVVEDEYLRNVSDELTAALAFGGVDPATAFVLGQQFGQIRPANSEDLLVLTSRSIIGKLNSERLQALIGLGVPQETAAQLSVNGLTYPLEDQYVLIPEEQALITTAQASYNATIKSLAQANGLAFVDAKAILNQLAEAGISFDAGTLTSTFATGGAFSLDGVHPTPRGYAYLANQAIDAINSTYGSTIPKVNIGSYGTVNISN